MDSDAVVSGDPTGSHSRELRLRPGRGRRAPRPPTAADGAHGVSYEGAGTEVQARYEPRLGTALADYGQDAQDLRTRLGAIEAHVTDDKRDP